MADQIKVAIVEDIKHLREGLASLIGGMPGFQVIGSFATMEEALVRVEWEFSPVALIDIQLPGMSGIEGVRRLKALYPHLPILMLTVHDDNDRIVEAISAGAFGYLLKDTPPTRLLEAIRELHGGGAPMSPQIAHKVVTMFQRSVPPKEKEHHLSPREMEVLKLLINGHSYKTAAFTLEVSQDTIRFHIRHIYEKLHVHSKSEAVSKAFQTGILP